MYPLVNSLYKFFLLQFAYFLLLCQSGFSQDLCKPVGWATFNGDVTGGGSVTPINVTTMEEFKALAKSAGPKVIYVKGTIGSGVSDQVNVSSDKTIIGLPGAKVKGFMNLSNCNNVIVRNIIFQGPGSIDVNGVDNMTITAGTRIWIDHCEFKDGQDGNLDLKRQSDFIAITWCKFSYTSLSTNHQYSDRS